MLAHYYREAMYIRLAESFAEHVLRETGIQLDPKLAYTWRGVDPEQLEAERTLRAEWMAERLQVPQVHQGTRTDPGAPGSTTEPALKIRPATGRAKPGPATKTPPPDQLSLV